jgi:mRNA-degrading endonuclease RelE of RelBE toxin-antitoxin system
MRLTRSNSFKRSFKKLPKFIQKKADRILILLASDLQHPSIRAKKIQGEYDVWEGRIDKFYRFTFQIEADEILLRSIGSHGITKKR